MLRKIMLLLAVLVLLAAGAVLVASLVLDKDKVLELAAKTLHQQTGATLTVAGDTSLSLFPTLGVSLEEAAIILPGKTAPDIQVRSVAIGVQFMPLLSGQVEIDTFSLDGLSARIEMAPAPDPVDTSKMNDAQLDAFYAERRAQQAKAEASADAEGAVAVPLALNVKRLTVTGAHVELIDPTGAPPTIIDLVELQATGLNLEGRTVPLRLTVELPGEQTMTAELAAEVRIDQASQLATLDAFTLTLSGATPTPLEVAGTGSVHLARQIADLQLQLTLGAMRGDGTLRYASYESPQIDTTLQLNLLDPALLVLAGPEAAAAAPDDSPESSQDGSPDNGDEPLPLDAIRAIDTRAVLSVEQARFDAHTINNLQVMVRAVDGIVQLNKLSGELHGGQLAANATFNGKHNTATLTTSGGLKGLDIATALTAVESETALTGKANLSWQLDSKGRTPNELTAALFGMIELDTQEIVLEGTSVEKLLCQAVALTNKQSLTSTFPNSTRMQTLGAKIQLADGKATLAPLTATLPQMGLTGTGEYNLLSGEFAATFKAKLSKELEQLDSACRVSNTLTAIDWPVKCSGNTSEDPDDWCSVDTQNIIKDLAINEGRKTIEKKASRFFEKLLKKSD